MILGKLRFWILTVEIFWIIIGSNVIKLLENICHFVTQSSFKSSICHVLYLNHDSLLLYKVIIDFRVFYLRIYFFKHLIEDFISVLGSAGLTKCYMWRKLFKVTTLEFLLFNLLYNIYSFDYYSILVAGHRVWIMWSCFSVGCERILRVHRQKEDSGGRGEGNVWWLGAVDSGQVR